MNRAAALASAAALGAAASAAVLALAGAFSAAGPGAYAGAGDERIREVLNSARESLKAERPKEAEAIYRDLVASRPLDANAHLLLGIHLQDLAKDPFGAIGQFNDFLRLAPDSEKAAMARERIHACELAIAKRLHAEDASAGAEAAATPSAETEARVRELLADLAAARAEAADLRDAVAAIRSERDRLERDNAAKQNQIDALKGRGTSARAPTDDLTKRFDRLTEEAEADLPAAAPTETIPRPRPTAGDAARIGSFITYEVKRGDTLWKIAQKAYNDGSRTAEIKAANPGLVGADGSVREGTILKIPR